MDRRRNGGFGLYFYDTCCGRRGKRWRCCNVNKTVLNVRLHGAYYLVGILSTVVIRCRSNGLAGGGSVGDGGCSDFDVLSSVAARRHFVLWIVSLVLNLNICRYWPACARGLYRYSPVSILAPHWRRLTNI